MTAPVPSRLPRSTTRGEQPTDGGGDGGREVEAAAEVLRAALTDLLPPGSYGWRTFAALALHAARSAAAPNEDPRITAVLALHQPWYEINGKRYENTVTVSCGQFDGCDGTDERWCSAGENDGHEVPGCSECRTVIDGDLSGYLLWPCPTVRALQPAALLAEQPGGGR